MGKLTKPMKRKVVNKIQGTIYDKRLKRSTALSKLHCPKCYSSRLREKSKDGFVWGFCENCTLSGEKNKIKDNFLVEACDIIFTLTDTMCDL